MKTSIPRTLLTAIPALAAAGCTENPAPRPNVIFILMDDAGYGDFGCYGQQKIETPNIDALSELGIRFTDMYSAAPLSSPARCGLLTGRHAGHAQIRANDEMEWRGDVWNHEAMLRDSTLEGQAPLEAGTPTLGSVMQQAGYATAMIGKWGVGGPATEGTPNKMGFGTYYGCICQRQAHTYYPPFLWQNDRRVYLDNELLPPGTPLDAGADPYDPRSYDKYTQRTYSPDAMYDQVLEFVNANKERPFFLMWTTPIPHSPMQAPDADVQYYVRKFGDEQPIEGKGYFPSRWPRATYAAMITYFDRQIGGLVAARHLGKYGNRHYERQRPGVELLLVERVVRQRPPVPQRQGLGQVVVARGRYPDALHRGVGRQTPPAGERPCRLFPRCDADPLRIGRGRAPRDRRHFVPAGPRRAQTTAARISLLGVPRQQRLGSRPLGRMERFAAPCEGGERPL